MWPIILFKCLFIVNILFYFIYDIRLLIYILHLEKKTNSRSLPHLCSVPRPRIDPLPAASPLAAAPRTSSVSAPRLTPAVSPLLAPAESPQEPPSLATPFAVPENRLALLCPALFEHFCLVHFESLCILLLFSSPNMYNVLYLYVMCSVSNCTVVLNF